MGTSEAGKTQEQVPPVYNAFPILEIHDRHLMGILLPIPSDIGPKASARRETPNRKIKKCVFFIYCFSY